MIRRGRTPFALVALVATAMLGVAAIPAGAQTEPEDDPYAPYRFTIGESAHEPEARVPEYVIGTDTRTQVLDTTKKLPRKVVHIVFTFPGQGDFQCTGSLIGPEVVATAGHCLYDTDNDVAATNFRVFPGRASRKSKPFGKCTATDSEAQVPQAYKDAIDSLSAEAVTYDFGAVQVDCDQTQTSVFDLAVYNFTNSNDVVLNLNAYHGDKAPGTQWKSKDITVFKFDDVPLVAYKVDTFGGSSGGGLQNKSLSGCTCILAINTLELQFTNGQLRNAGVIVTADVKQFFDDFESTG
jgi:glutamyl endopeptidase